MSQAIKSKNFDTFILRTPEQKKFEGFSFTSVLIKYDSEDCFIIVKGDFKLFERNNKGKKSYSLGLRTDDDNREW